MHYTRTLNDLTVAELIGECIMPRLKIEQFAENGAYAREIRRMVGSHEAGGFCVFGGTPESVAATMQELQSLAMTAHGIPLLFSCDCEFGLPMRLVSGGTEFPDAMAIAQTGDPELAFRVGSAIAKEMRAIGLTWNFAPVVDVNSNHANPIINTRSFGEDPETVGSFAKEFMRGSISEGVATTAKHFPGHGDTSKDSHRELPFVEGGWERFRSLELPPFCDLITAGVDTVMPGHLAAPELASHFGAKGDNSTLPATLSRTLVTTLLREKLEFGGVVVTDALDMHAITDLYGEREAMVRSLAAGVDILLLPKDPQKTFDALVEANESGKITVADLQERVARILKLKHKYSITTEGIDARGLEASREAHNNLAREVGERALLISGNVDLAKATLLIISDDRTQAVTKALRFKENAAPYFQQTRLVMINEWSKAENVDSNTVIATFHRARGYIDGVVKDVTMRSVIEELGQRLRTRNVAPRGLIGFGSPYLDTHFSLKPGFVIKTFSESGASVDAVTRLLARSR